MGFFVSILATQASPDQLLEPVSQATAKTSLHSKWTGLLSDRTLYLQTLDHTLSRCVQALNTFTAGVIESDPIPASNPGINLWAGPNQETGFIPVIKRIRWLPRGHSKTPAKELLKMLLPPRYRLAEQMGIGRNELLLVTRFIDPKIQSRVPYGFSLNSRILHDFYGTFSWQGTNQVETFRYQIDSISRSGSATANFGPGVKPHHIGLSQEQIENSYNRGSFRAWEKENLQERIIEEGFRIQPSRQQERIQAPQRSQLDREINRKLQTWRTKIEHHAQTTLSHSPEMEAFIEAASKLKTWSCLSQAEPLQDVHLLGIGSHAETAKRLVRLLSAPSCSTSEVLDQQAYWSAMEAIQELSILAHDSSETSLWSTCHRALTAGARQLTQP